MAHVLTLSHDSDVTLTAGVYAVSYTPKEAGNAPTVTESLMVRIVTTSRANVITAIQAINRSFTLAERRRDRGSGTRVYVKFKVSSDSETYRSELWSDDKRKRLGRVEVLEPTMYFANIDKFVAKLKVTWTRRNYWEDNAETALTISNGSGSADDGVAIVNFNGAAVFTDTTVSFVGATKTIADSGNGFAIFGVGDVISLRGSTSNDGIYTVATTSAAAITVNEPVVNEDAGDGINIYDIGNYVHIDSAVIGGELPAACRIEITSDDGGDSLETCWIGQNVLSGPETFAHILEAGDGAIGSDDVDATSSSAIHHTFAISDTEAVVERWTIPTETLTAADGGYFKVFARFAASTNITAVKWRLKILYSGTVIWQGGQVQFDDTHAKTVRIIRELDTVQLPPFSPENSVPTDLTFELWGVRTAGAINVDLDCLMLMPLDGYRRLRSLEGLVQNAELIDDGVTGTYYQEVSNEQVRDIAAAGDQIMLWPNEDNRIYFLLHSIVASKADMNRTASVIIYYRPRRVSI